MARRPRTQTCHKHFCGECFFCGEACYAVLDAHRIVPGAEGGRYDWANILTVCAVCHRKITEGLIVVYARLGGSYGGTYIHYRGEDGVEIFKKEERHGLGRA